MTTLQLFQSLSDLSQNRRPKAIAILIGYLGITYLIWKVVILWGFDVDFKYIWLSGHLWGVDESPYGHLFQQQGTG